VALTGAPLPNPFYMIYQQAAVECHQRPSDGSRIDGPTPQIARSIVTRRWRPAESTDLGRRAYFGTRACWQDEQLFFRRRGGFDRAEICPRTGIRFSENGTPTRDLAAGGTMSHIAIYAGCFITRPMPTGRLRDRRLSPVPARFAYHLQCPSAARCAARRITGAGPLLAKARTCKRMGRLYEP